MVVVIRGTERRNEMMVGKLVRNFTVTCNFCHAQEVLIGQKREIVKKLKDLGWFQEYMIWFCHRHVLQDLQPYWDDPDGGLPKKEAFWKGDK
jgi:hypothetical protein